MAIAVAAWPRLRRARAAARTSSLTARGPAACAAGRGGQAVEGASCRAVPRLLPTLKDGAFTLQVSGEDAPHRSAGVLITPAGRLLTIKRLRVSKAYFPAAEPASPGRLAGLERNAGLGKDVAGTR
ncbi:hypothetical protein [Streptosporangium sandarakinum]|uniref:hypothetical protein n=1 Tax=Streptosporangium sandarakinum TaxID=1260955 RepID=UPI0037A93FC1